MDIDESFKLLLVGDSGVGKSSILLRYTDDVFSSLQPTIGVDFRVKTMCINGRNVKCAIWDTAGQERFRTLTSAYYRGAHGVILVYDVGKRESFESLKDTWLAEVEMYCTRSAAAKMIVGNKIDTNDRVVSTEEGEAIARESGATFVELSAKMDTGVKETFEKLIGQILDTPELCANDSEGNGSIRPGESAYSVSDYCSAC